MPKQKTTSSSSHNNNNTTSSSNNTNSNSKNVFTSSSIPHRTANPAPNNVLRVLIATDNHLGFAEKDPIRGEDSFRTMDEILSLGVSMKCDMGILGGDLFHMNKPSRNTMYHAQHIFKKNVLGDGPISIQVVSNQEINFGKHQCVNYEDPNLSVQLPIFIIHGNHDDPTRDGTSEALSAIDILAEAGLVNYFGRTDTMDEIKIRPVLIEKGPVKLALYGLGWVRDERLHRLFTERKIQFVKPKEERPNEWYSIFVVHQNRDYGRGPKNFVPESMIPEFIDLVIWGHEHECKITPFEPYSRGEKIQNPTNGKWYVSQPGSSVAISLVEGEAVEKKCAILEISILPEEEYPYVQFHEYPLLTVRPFFLETKLELRTVEGKGKLPRSSDIAEKDKQEVLFDFLTDEVKDLVDKAKEEKPLDPNGKPWIPLIRLKVDHTGWPTINLQKFGAQFVSMVANPAELLQFYKKKIVANTIGSGQGNDDELASDDEGYGEDSNAQYVSPVEHIQRYTEEALNQGSLRLEILVDKTMMEAVEEYVDKDTTTKIEDFIMETMENWQKRFKKDLPSLKDTAGAAVEQKMDLFIKDIAEESRKRANLEKEKKDLAAERDFMEKQRLERVEGAAGKNKKKKKNDDDDSNSNSSSNDDDDDDGTGNASDNNDVADEDDDESNNKKKTKNTKSSNNKKSAAAAAAATKSNSSNNKRAATTTTTTSKSSPQPKKRQRKVNSDEDNDDDDDEIEAQNDDKDVTEDDDNTNGGKKRPTTSSSHQPTKRVKMDAKKSTGSKKQQRNDEDDEVNTEDDDIKISSMSKNSSNRPTTTTTTTSSSLSSSINNKSHNNKSKTTIVEDIETDDDDIVEIVPTTTDSSSNNKGSGMLLVGKASKSNKR
jgi:double-strand break repair protein MRE11